MGLVSIASDVPWKGDWFWLVELTINSTIADSDAQPTDPPQVLFFRLTPTLPASHGESARDGGKQAGDVASRQPNRFKSA